MTQMNIMVLWDLESHSQSEIINKMSIVDMNFYCLYDKWTLFKKL